MLIADEDGYFIGKISLPVLIRVTHTHTHTHLSIDAFLANGSCGRPKVSAE